MSKKFKVRMDILIPIEVEVEALDWEDAEIEAKHYQSKNYYVDLIDKSLDEGNEVVEVVDVEEIHD